MEENKITFEWHSILKDIAKNFWVVILSALIGLMGIFIVTSSVYTPEYTSTATIVVNAKGNSSSSLYGVSVEMAEIFSKVFVDPTMKEKAAAHLGRESFNGSIEAKVLTDTNFVELKVTSDTPQAAYEHLKAVLEVYPDLSASIFENAVINVIKSPSMPKAPSNSLPLENRNLVMALCAAAALAMIVVISVFRDTVKNEEIFNNKIDAKLIAAIPHEIKKKSMKDHVKRKEKGLFIDGNPYISLRFAETFHKIAAKIEYMKSRTGDKVFAITSVAENEGKSTVSSNIAISLARKGNKVVLIDLDGKKPALYKIFGMKYLEQAELGKLFNGEIKRNEFRLRRYKRTSLSLAINVNAYPDNHLWIESGIAKDVINALKPQVDYIIIDTAPLSVDSTVTDISKFVDQTMLVVRTDKVRTTSINDAILTIGEVGGNLAGCILNDVYPDFAFFGVAGSEDNGGYYYSKKGYGKSYSSYGKYAEMPTDDDYDESEGVK